MATTTSKIQIRRGPQADFIGGSGIVLDEGEPALVLDTRQVFIGYGSDYFPAGNLRLISQLDGLDSLFPSRGNYSMAGNRITNLDAAVDPNDAVNLAQLQATVGLTNTVALTRSLTLAANTGAAAPVEVDAVPSTPAANSLNALAGAFSGFKVSYTAVRGSGLQVGELLISDSGTNTSFAHTSVETPSVGSVGITFSVAYATGVRQLRYVTTAGSSIVFRFFITRWV
jgi:hypothetical protein